MSQKKIIIWSLVLGFVVNAVALRLTFDISFLNCIGATVDTASAALTIKGDGAPLCGSGGMPFDVISGRDKTNWLVFVLDFLFWTFIVWFVLTVIRKIKNANIKVQNDSLKF